MQVAVISLEKQFRRIRMKVSIPKDGRAASILAPHCLPEKGCKGCELEFHDNWERRER